MVIFHRKQVLMSETFRVGIPHRTFINMDTCKSRIPIPKKVETYAKPRTGKGLCCPVIDKSLLNKSKTGSMAIFRDTFGVFLFLKPFLELLKTHLTTKKEM